ncbi:DUF4355 domain-containing protein [Planococcus halocryophilus]|uniref:DUF4355 domain-containing protein n=1 Tax=Planococcus halocryophilus TaxID=1215089 RepID=UPI001F0F113F|nr:DUF4355 domain-containing protein [Planococcus halocryophilus]MCH4825781.1 DUF4355 domain-containing protein [Planococcus halocryophilus]
MDELNKQQEEVTEIKQEDEQTQQTQEETVKTFSEEEVEKLIQAETDRKVSKALETAKSKWQEDFKTQLETEKSEAEKLAKMTEGERFQAELNRQKEEFENERKSFLKEKLENQTIKELSNQNLPIEFANFVNGETAEEVHQNITTFKAEWDKAFTIALEKAVNERVQGKTPQSSNKQSSLLNVTKDEFRQMNYSQKLNVKETDPELYAQLKG